MKRRNILTWALSVMSASLLVAHTFAQNQPPRLPAGAEDIKPASVQAPLDPGYQALIATCKTPPQGRGRGAGGGNRGRGPQAPQGIREYTVTEIPGVIKGGEKWTFVWQEAGNNGDGIVGTNDGSLLLAQNDDSKILKLDKDGRPSVAYSDTHTGGSVTINPKGAVFAVERGLHQRIEQLAPQRKVFADSYNGEPLDCLGGVLNDIISDSKGGVYFTMGQLFYVNPQGMVTKQSENLNTNGLALSPDEKTLYVTNGGTLAAFDVQKDGSLTNQREFAKLMGGGGDGSTVDSKGRIFVTSGAGVEVIDPSGKNLGVIPTPRGVITCAFGGKNKKTLYILARGGTTSKGDELANVAQVWTIPMETQGFKGRMK
ncbi:MAG TPA: SMP-30/gluconolactonase/LRE family protein [Vicinamibacterales bacterium]|nr:SMP-30/gluconolactonase/LRE family protein [Vicinamibacterales bacterium]